MQNTADVARERRLIDGPGGYKVVQDFDVQDRALLDGEHGEGTIDYTRAEEPLVVEMTEAEVIASLTHTKPREVWVPAGHDTLIPVHDIQVDVPSNMPDEAYLNNIKINGARTDVQWLTVIPEHDGHAVMVGGGSSLELPSQLHEIAQRQREWKQTIFALNGAAKYLSDRHFQVDYQVIIDARPGTVKFLHGLHARKYLISSQCDPSLFHYLVEHGRADDVLMFHPPHPGLSAALPKGRNVVMIGGEYTVGLTALSVATALGYRFLHLYGYDSSDSDDGRAHAYQQGQTDAESRRLEIVCGGRKFSCGHAMFKQAEAFPRAAQMLADFGCTITVHGDGLLPTVAHQMVQYDAPANAACYNMANAPASFDFITWLVVAEMDRRRRGVIEPLMVAFTDGPEEGFRPNDVQNTREKQQILDCVMRPALKLFGATESEHARSGRQFHYWYRPITDGFRTGEAVPRCEVPTNALLDVMGWLLNHGFRSDPDFNPIVITLRETRYSPERNSDLDSWVTFARRRRDEGEHVIFVRDTRLAEEPIKDFLICAPAARDLLFRAALYSLARCNLIIANGPAELLQFSDWPFIEFKPPHLDPTRPIALGISWWQRFAGITPPEGFPWHGKHQLTVWQRDTVDVIEDAWQRWLKATTET